MSKKTDEEFLHENLQLYIENGKTLSQIDPEIVNEYGNHSVLKLICMHYWIGFFCPICYKNLKEKYGYNLAYIDTMAGAGVTANREGNNFFCGSCTGAIIRSNNLGKPFDFILAVESDKTRGETLVKRLSSIFSSQLFQVYSDSLENVSDEIVRFVNSQKQKTVSYIVIDPEGFEGLTWKAIFPLLTCKGDAMITWFEDGAWRIKQAAVQDHRTAEGQARMIEELLGPGWRTASNPNELTDLFIQRVRRIPGKEAVGKVKISQNGSPYYMLLFSMAGNESIVKKWENEVSRRIGSVDRDDLSTLLEVESGRQKTLFGSFK
jgi:three-Cys-motif partner protein